MLPDEEVEEMLLKDLGDAYPDEISADVVDRWVEQYGKEEVQSMLDHLFVCGAITSSGTTRSSDGKRYWDLNNLKLTGPGVDYLIGPGSIGYKIGGVTIRIHKQTLASLEDIIKSAVVPEHDKQTLLKRLKEKGESAFATQLVDLALTNAKVAGAMLAEMASNLG